MRLGYKMETVKTVDEGLLLVGELGLHQILVVGILCLLTVPSTFQALIIIFVADNPAWRCVANSTICTFTENITSKNLTAYRFRCGIPRNEWEFVKPEKYSIVTEFDLSCDRENLIFVATSLFFAGMAKGSILIGWSADKLGRIKMIIPCTVCCITVAFISSFSTSYWIFAMTRYIIGFAAPGTIVMFFVIGSEITGPKYRPLTGIILWLFFTIGLVILGVVAMFVQEWKMLMIYSTAPYLVLLPLLFFIPESLRWLHVTGQVRKAYATLKKIAHINGRAVDVHLKPIKAENKSVNPLLLFATTSTMLKSINIGFAWMVSGLVYYGMSLAIGDLSGHMHRDFILASLMEFPACMVAILGSMYWGRKGTTQIPLFLGGICCACVSAISETDERKVLADTRVALGLAGKFFLTLSYDTIYTWTVELYPTQIRTEAVGYVQITSRLGAMASPWVAKWLKRYHWRLPFAVMGILAIIASGFLHFLPETRLQKTAELIEQSNPDKEDQELDLVSNEPF